MQVWTGEEQTRLSNSFSNFVSSTEKRTWARAVIDTCGISIDFPVEPSKCSMFTKARTEVVMANSIGTDCYVERSWFKE